MTESEARVVAIGGGGGVMALKEGASKIMCLKLRSQEGLLQFANFDSDFVQY